MDIKAKIEELSEKIKNDKSLKEDFKKDPANCVKKLIGVDIPTDKLDEVVDCVKAKIKLDGIGDKIGGIFGKK